MVFAVADTAVLRPHLGVDAPRLVVEMGLLDERGRFGPWSPPDFLDMLAAVEQLDAAALFAPGEVSIQAEEGARSVGAAYVSSAYFDVIGAAPTRGRGFTAAEDRGPGEHAVAIVGHALSQERFGGPLDAIGATIRLNREPHTVVGVSPPGFRGHMVGMDAQVILPITQHPRARVAPSTYETDRTARWSQVLGRLAPASSLQELQLALDGTFSRLAQVYPATNDGVRARAVRLGVGPVEDRGLVVVWFGVVGLLALLVLGVTASNVGGMLLAQTATRRREVVIQFALGANRRRVVGSLLADSALIFIVGGGVGIVLARWLLGINPNFLVSSPTPIPPTMRAVFDWRTIGFAMSVTAGMAGLFGFLPALHAARLGLADTLRNEISASSKKAGRLRGAIVVGQVSVSMLLLTSAAIITGALGQTAGDDELEVLDRTFITPIDLTRERYGSAETAPPFLETLVSRVAAMPEAEGVAVATDFPLDNQRLTTVARLEDRLDVGRRLPSYISRVMPGYFDVLRIARQRGRVFSPDDNRLAPRVVVVNELFAETAWAGTDPLGRSLYLGDDPAPYSVIGVVENTRPKLATDPLRPQIFTVLLQDFDPRVRLAVVHTGGSEGFVGRLREVVRTVGPEVPLSPTRTHRAYSRDGLAFMSIAATGASGLGTLAWLLASIGIYGIVAFGITHRTREIGVRVALGATRADVLALVLRAGLRLALPGLLIGGGIAIGVSHLIRAGLPGASPVDLQVLGTVSLLFVVLVIAACVGPARHASAIEPSVALRAE